MDVLIALVLKKNANIGMTLFVFLGTVWKSEIIYFSEIIYL